MGFQYKFSINWLSDLHIFILLKNTPMGFSTTRMLVSINTSASFALWSDFTLFLWSTKPMQLLPSKSICFLIYQSIMHITASVILLRSFCEASVFFNDCSSLNCFTAFNDSLEKPGFPSTVSYHRDKVLGCGKHVLNCFRT